MRASALERMVAELHGVVSALRSVPTNDPRWHIYWAETLRLCQAIDANAPAPITNHGVAEVQHRSADLCEEPRVGSAFGSGGKHDEPPSRGAPGPALDSRNYGGAL